MRRALRAGLWRWYLAAGVAASGLYYLLPRGSLGQGIFYCGVGISMPLAIAIGIRWHRPRPRYPWYILLAGMGLHAAVANLIWVLYPLGLGKSLPFPSVADVFFIVAYVTELVVMMILIRIRIGRSDRAGTIDSVLITMGLAVLSWFFLMAQSFQATGSPVLAKITSIAYPLLDILLVGVVIRLMSGSGSRPPAYWFVILSIACQLGADTGLGITSLSGSFHYGSPIFFGWILTYVFLGAAALHPSMVSLTSRAEQKKPEPTVWRLGFLTGAALVPLGSLAFEEIRHQHVDDAVIATIAAVMFLLVFVRLRSLIVDVSRLARTGQALEEKYQAIVESTKDWLWETDAGNRITYSNTAVERILGYTPEELAGLGMVALVDDSERENVLSQRLRLAATKSGWTGVVTLWRHRDDSSRYLESNATPILSDTGELLGYRGNERDVTERRAMEEQIAHQALYDHLTDLANRTLFNDRLSHTLRGIKRHHRPVAILMIDLDGFKAINDTFGHGVGDQVLIETASRIKGCVRAMDTAARLGGDEFAVLMVDASVEEAMLVAGRITDSMKPPFRADDQELFLDASVGIAESTGTTADPDQLLRNADAAMYAAKREGKGGCQVYRSELHDDVLERLALGTSLRRAIEHHEFTLHYQPIVFMENGRTKGFEALIRWNREGRGLVSPAEFIPVAEQTGLIVPIDRWVMMEACRQARLWQTQFPSVEPLEISVNVSAKQLYDAGLVKHVQGALVASGLDPATLTLELTESVVMAQTETTIRVLSELKGLGVRLAIDDFGIGFSSLSYLRRLPVDFIKIDRSFVSGVASNTQEWTLARGIIRLVHGLGLETIAEGVERADQLAHLRALGCRLAQGFYFAKPMEPEAVPRWLEQSRSLTA